ncbi:MAG: hypothetical protein ACE5GH_05165 [Fidelibacterota bacterium]
MRLLRHAGPAIAVCGLTASLLAQPIEIHGIAIEEKVNGTLIRISKTGKIDPGRITAWTSNAGWFYMTIMGATIDTTRPFPFVRTGIVSDFQSHQLKDLVQLGFRLNRSIGTFHIDAVSSRDEIVVVLRLPVKTSLSAISRLQSRQGKEESKEKTETDGYYQAFKDRLPYALMLAGAGLVTSGMIQSSAVEFILGGGILVGGYVMSIRNKPVPEDE